MSKELREGLENIVQIIAQCGNGASVEELLILLTKAVPKRTLQYRLSNLIRDGLVKIKGAGRNSRYYVEKILEGKAAVEDKIVISQDSSIIPLSTESKQLKKLISAPIQLRSHISYQRIFIDSYEPNKTFYLSQPILEKLATLGAGVEKGRPAGTYAKRIYHRLLILEFGLNCHSEISPMNQSENDLIRHLLLIGIYSGV